MSGRLGLPVVLSALLLLAAVITNARGEYGWYQETSNVSSNLRGVDFVDGDRGWVCGDGSTILHTTDGGATWVPQSLSLYEHMRDIDFWDANVGYAVGGYQMNNSVWRTTNAGSSWTVIYEGDVYTTLNSVAVLSANTIWVGGTYYSSDGPPGTVQITTDGGATWSFGSITWNDGHPCAVSVLDVSPLTAQSAFISCRITRYDNSTYGLAFKTTDSGASFQVLPGSSHDQEIQFVNSQTGFYGPASVLQVTTDGGATWTSHPGAQDQQHMYFLDAHMGWGAGFGGMVCKTANGGATWTGQVSGTTANLNKIHFITANVGTAVGANGTILHTFSGGDSDVDGVPVAKGGGALRLSPPEPNPSFGPMRIEYTLPRPEPVRIAIFDIRGRMVRSLSEAVSGGGGHAVSWNGADASSRLLPPGVYYVRLASPDGIRRQTVTLIR